MTTLQFFITGSVSFANLIIIIIILIIIIIIILIRIRIQTLIIC